MAVLAAVLLVSLVAGLPRTEPAGAGPTDLLLVTADGTASGRNADLSALFTTFGWTVTVIDDDASAAALNSAADGSAVVYVTAGSNSTVTIELATSRTPVVSEDASGWAELMRAPGSLEGTAGPFTDIDVVDASNPITSPLGTGMTTVFSSGQSWATWTGAIGSGMDTLATAPSSANPVLMTVESGAALVSGTAENRRVFFGIESAPLSSWNSTLEAMVERSLDWAAAGTPASGTTGSPIGNLVMVTVNGGFGGNTDASKRNLFESFGWTVTALDDDATPAEVTAAAMANDVMFLSDSVNGTEAYDVRNEAIGIVNENFSAWSGFLNAAAQDQSFTMGTALNVVDTTHPITAASSFGSVTIHAASDDINYWDSGVTALPAGVDVLAEAPASSNFDALLAADAGATLYSSYTAVDRRVWFPSDFSDPGVWTVGYETLLQRSLLWAASLPVDPLVDSDSDGLWDEEEDANTDADNDPTTSPGPNTDGDVNPNYLDSDDDGDGTATASENADPNGDGDPRDALDNDFDGEPDYLDSPTDPSGGAVAAVQKISDTAGSFGGVLDNGDAFGRQTVPIGDLDGDGIVDLMAGVPSDDDGGSNRGAAYILFMNADGTVSSEQKISDTAGNFTATLDDGDSLGESVGPVGDLNGDGRIEVAVAANRDGDGGGNSGAVYILFLETNGTVASHVKVSSLTPGVTLGSGTYFGESVIGPGDVNGDGVPDLAVGALFDSDGGSSRGAVHIFFLDETGSVIGQQKISETSGDFVTTLDNGDEFGSSVGSLGDLDGDGAPDIIVGARGDDDGGSGTGAAYVLFLDPDGTVKAEHKISATSGDLTGEPGAGTWFGRSVAGVGDVDGDGNTDALVGAPFDGTGGSNTGATHLLFLRSDGTVRDHLRYDSTTSGLTGQLESGDEFGTGVGALGDLDGDGTLGLIMTARYDDDGGSTRGAVYVIDLQRATAPGVVLVNSTGDGADATPGDEVCNTGGTNSEGIQECTLRAAIEESNASASIDTIEFAIPNSDPNHLYYQNDSVTDSLGAPVGTAFGDASITDFDPDYPVAPFSWWSIEPAADLPYVTSATTIDGTTQPGWQPNTAIDGSPVDMVLPIRVVNPGFETLALTGGGATVKGLQLSSSNGSATMLGLYGTGGHTAEGLWLMTDPTGSANAPGDFGIYETAGGNQIGGPDPSDLVLVGDGFGGTGVDIGGNGNTLQNVWIGVSVLGNETLGGYNDIALSVTGDDNIIGTPGAGVISATSLNGQLYLTGDRNTVQGSRFGILADGTLAPDNRRDQVVIRGVDNMFGGVNPGEGNIVVDGTNPWDTLEITAGSGHSVLGSLLLDLDGEQLYLDISPPAGPNTNDVGDLDSGVNGLLNHPVITSITDLGSNLDVDFELDVPAGDYRIEFFGNDATGAPGTGYGAGDFFIGAAAITHAGAGAQSFSTTLSDAGDHYLAATATEDLGGGDYGSTSEFGRTVCVGDSDGDGLCDDEEDVNTDSDGDPSTNPGPNTDGDANANYLDADDDGDGTPTASEKADPNGDGDPRDAVDSDGDGEPDYLDLPAGSSGPVVASVQKISQTAGGFTGLLADGDTLGGSVTAIGDLDGDGVVDVVVAADQDDTGGTNNGAVWVLLLNADGTVKTEQKIASGTGGLAHSFASNERFGSGIAEIGDLDGDGRNELAVGAVGDLGDGGTSFTGAVHVLFLNANGTVRDEVRVASGAGGFATTIDDNDNFGSGVAGIGDVDGDGIPDMAVGANGDDDGGNARGAVHVLFMNADGTVRAEQKISQTSGGLSATIGDTDFFGVEVEGIGDVDGNGVPDLAVGATGDDEGATSAGAVYVLLLDTDGTLVGDHVINASSGDLRNPPDDSFELLGGGIAGVGDLDGDGVPEIAVGASEDEFGGVDHGSVRLLYLRADGSVKRDATIGEASSVLGAVLPIDTSFGSGVAAIGDLDGDGPVGLLVGASSDDDGGSNRGAVYVLDLSADPCGLDADSDGLWDCEEDDDTDFDGDPATNPGPNTDGDANANYLDADDDGDGTPTASENADPNGDGDPRDARDSDHDGQPDYLDPDLAGPSSTPIAAEQKISNTSGGLAGPWTTGSWAGTSVASIGDLDGDGVTDVAVGANGDDDGGSNRGAVWVLFLNADGSVKAEQKISDTAGGFAGVLDNGDQFGSSVTGPGDIDGDGVPDLVVGALLDDDGGGSGGQGAVYVLFLNANGTVKAEQKISVTVGGLSAVLDENDEFGHAVEGLGDLDGDGIPDIAVGAWGDDDGGVNRGAVYVLFLNANGTVKAEQKISDTAGGLVATIPDGSNFGVGLGELGDVDSDGVTDLAVGAWNDTDGGSARGAVYLLFLNSDGTVKAEQKISDTAGGFAGTLDAGDDFGAGATGVGDVNGDGVPDLVVGAPRDDDGGSGRGAAWLLTLNTNGTVASSSKISSTAGALTGPLDDGDQFGYEMASLGDLDGDGAFDLLVGAWNDDDGAASAGAVYVLDLTTVACVGDSDGDGLCDAEEDANSDADGDPATNPGPNTDGDANPNYLDADDDGDGSPTASENADPNGDGDPRDALDTDRDGQPDYLDAPTIATTRPVVAQRAIFEGTSGFVGPVVDGGGFGHGLASIGDLDDDGVVDLAIGSNWGAVSDEGEIWILFMNADGTVRAEQRISDGVGGLTATLDSSDEFGRSIAGIGDLDGDGVEDIAVGAIGDDDGAGSAGAVYILFLNVDGTVKAEQKISDLEGGLATTLDGVDWFGWDVTGVGDVDSDGLPDIVVGTGGDDDGGSGRGAVYVLFLNADGTVKAEQKISDLEGGLTATLDNGDGFGEHVAWAGDVDGDGVEDLVVGATGDDDGGSGRGAVYVLFLNVDGTVKAEQKISDTAGGLATALANLDRFGMAVAGVGDLDLDGVPDVVVTASRDAINGGTGTAFLLTLNPDGTVKTERELLDVGDGQTTDLGTSISGLGDLDGDGTIGLALADPYAAGAGSSEGEVFLIDLCAAVDTDGDGLWDCEEDANFDADGDPATNPGPNTDGDANPNYLDADDDGDGIPTASENADQNGDGDPRDARDADVDGEPDYLDAPTTAASGLVTEERKISSTSGGLVGPLDDGDTFGSGVAPIGDLDGDGVVDVVVGAATDDDGGPDRGAVYVLFLNADGSVKAERKISDIVGGLSATLDDGDFFGEWVGNAGDLDGDGRNEVVVGARNDDDGGPDRGAVYVLFLNADGTVRAEQKISDTAGGLAASLDDDDEFGVAVDGLGDVDGDGIDDLVVGAIHDDDGGPDRGAVYVLFLNADGTVRAEQKISDTAGALATALDDGDAFGEAVAGSGDVDGDGTPDLAVGVWADDDGATDAGAVFVLFLNPDGTVRAEQKISATAGGLAASLESLDWFGGGLGAVGDIDADGIADLLVGAPGDGDGGANRGAAYVLLLNADGTVKSEQKISDLSGGLTASLGNDDWFGVAVRGIGDLDADGTIDIAVGAMFDDDGGSNRGAVYLLDLSPPARIVNSTGDSGDAAPGDGVCDTGAANALGADECTLRAAIEEANAVGTAFIEFDIPVADSGHTADVWTIALGTELPDIAVPTTIDASTQPGWTDTPVIELDGSATTGADGLSFASGAAESSVRSLAIGGFDDNGIEVRADRVSVVGNHLGVDASGAVARPMGGDLLSVDGGDDVRVGGPGADRNLLTAGTTGVVVRNSSTVRIEGNLFGTDATGTAVLSSLAGDGIRLESDAPGATIVDNTIGSVGDDAIDVRSGSGSFTIQSNSIGTDPTGSATLPIGDQAILVTSVSGGGLIGGTGPGEGNAIANLQPGQAAIELLGSSTDQVTIVGNTADHVGAFIDLEQDGPTSNDTLDADDGANGLLNYPEPTITSSTTTDSVTWTVGLDVVLDVPAGDYRIEVYSSSLASYGGVGRAQELVHTFDVAHSGGGAQTFSSSYLGPEPLYVSTSTTEILGASVFGSTSELSLATLAVPSILTVNSTGDAADEDTLVGSCDTGSLNSAGDPECTLRSAMEQANVATGVTIEFAIPESDPGFDADGFWSIGQASDLPDLFGPGLMVDGASQPAFDGSRPVIQIADDNGGGDTFGVRAADITLAALSVIGSGDEAIQLEGERSTIDQMWLGLEPGGAVVESSGAGQDGVLILSTATGLVIQDSRIAGFENGVATFNGTIDATVSGTAIFDNRSLGVEFDVDGRVTLLGNSIHDNGGLGFELGSSDGSPLPNDVGDGDSGPNDLLNKPIITTATLGAGTVDVDYTLDVPAGTYRIEFFDNDRPDPTGFGEGQTFLSAESIVHPGGSVSYLATVVASEGDVITATATPDLGGGTYGGTSEFSNARSIGIVFVNSTGDSGDLATGDGVCDTGSTNADGNVECTLRAAVEEANASTGVDIIHFQLPASDANAVTGGSIDHWVISPGGSLPGLTDVAVLDATTQPSWDGTPLVGLDGGSAGAGLDGFGGIDQIEVSGLSLTGWSASGVSIVGSAVALRSNWFGVTPDGVVEANAVSDVIAYGSASSLTVGGPDDADGNVFAASGSGDGLVIVNSVTDVLVEQNHFGAAADGVTALGSVTAELLVIADDTSNVTVRANQFGGSPAAAVYVGNNATEVDFVGNVFGTDLTGTADLTVGQALYLDTSGTVTFGGSGSADGNLVRNSTFDAIASASTQTGDVTLLGNSIAASGNLAFDNANDGPDVLDAGDGDGGPNGTLNFPEIVAVGVETTAVVVTFDLDVPAGDYRIEAFSNPSGADPSGYGEGEVFVGTVSVTHAGSGSQRFEMSIAANAGEAISMTATRDLGGGSFGATSEYSLVETALSASTVEDLSVRSTDLFAAGGAEPVAVSGIADDGIGLEGGLERLVGPATDLTSGALTLSAWVVRDTAGSNPRIISKGTGAGVVYELLVDNSTDEVVARLDIGGTLREVRGGSAPVGSWHQVTVTWDGSTIRLFVDGSMVDSDAASGTLSANLDAPLVIGNTALGTAGLDGSIDQVELQHRAWSAAETQARFANGSTPASFLSLGGEQLGSPEVWSTSTDQSRSGGSALAAPLTAGGNAWITAVGIDEPGVEVTAWWWVSAPTTSEIAIGTRTGTAPTDQFEAASGPGGLDLAVVSGNARTTAATSATSVGVGTWQQVRISTDELGVTSFDLAGTPEMGPVVLSGLGQGSVGFRAADIDPTEQWFIDDVRVRRFVSDEPVTSLGPLERN